MLELLDEDCVQRVLRYLDDASWSRARRASRLFWVDHPEDVYVRIERHRCENKRIIRTGKDSYRVKLCKRNRLKGENRCKIHKHAKFGRNLFWAWYLGTIPGCAPVPATWIPGIIIAVVLRRSIKRYRKTIV